MKRLKRKSQIQLQTGRCFVVVALIVFSTTPTTGSPLAPVRERLSFNSDWRFIKGDPANTGDQLSYTNIKAWVAVTGAEFTRNSQSLQRPQGNIGANVAYTQPTFDDGSWRKLNLPHDWGIEGPFKDKYPGETGKLPWWGIGWYRKHFDVPASDQGRRLYLDVDGAMAHASVWLNGQYVGGWPYGYTSWRVDLTPYVKFGSENVLAIRLDNPPDSSRWYPGGGIYRNVWLVKTEPVHVGHWGTFVTTPEVSTAAATVNLKVTVDNNSKESATVSVVTEVFPLDAKGNKKSTAVARLAPVNVQIAPGTSAVADGTSVITNPKLWGPPPQQKPNRYVAVTTIRQGDKVVDSYETFFGIRTLKFDPNNGFFINGERVRLNGVCDHHDLGALGSAVNERALQRQLEMLAEMGCNAIRTSHNPPTPELLELADKMGFLVMDETFDCWATQKKTNDYHLLFADWHEQDTRALVRRDRNHPSVIMWSIGNEIPEQDQGASGAALAKELSDIVHEEDATRPTISAMNKARPDGPFSVPIDLIGLNYQGEGRRGFPATYSIYHSTFPNKFIVGAETASTISSRGEYTFPVATGFGAFPIPQSGDNATNRLLETSGPLVVRGEDTTNRQMSSYDLYWPPWATSPDKVFDAQRQFPFVAGEFVWTGWDYLGEPTPFDASRSSYFGIIDLAGFKKDRFFLYQSHWRPDLKMAHILPHWNWPERVGEVIPVHVYTSGDEGELFLNGKSLGRKQKGPRDLRLRWDDVVYQPGELKVVTYKNGRKWAADVMKTTGPAAGLTMQSDRSKIRADGKDLSFVTVTVKDENGLTVPRAKNRIYFEIEGPGEIVATDNGDPTSMESFRSHERNVFNGFALVIVRAKEGQPGTIKLTARSNGLKETMARINSK